MEVGERSAAELCSKTALQESLGSKNKLTFSCRRQIRGAVTHINYTVTLLKERIGVGQLKVVVQIDSARPDILHLKAIGMELRFGGEYLKAGHAEIMQDFIDVKTQAIADDDKTKTLAAAAIYQFTKARSHDCFFSDYLKQAFLVGFDRRKSFRIEAPDADFAVLIIFEELPPVTSGKSIQYSKADVTNSERAVKITLDNGFSIY